MAETLRRAAALMRERAKAAVPSPWQAVEGASGSWWVERPSTADIALDLHGENARHIASMHPAVALAVAEWLDAQANDGHAEGCRTNVSTPDGWGSPCNCCMKEALTVARTYLRESA